MQLCCSRIPLIDRLERLYAIVGATFLYIAGGWTLSSDVWHRCSVVAGRWLRAMRRGKRTRNGPWHEWAPGSHQGC